MAETQGKCARCGLAIAFSGTRDHGQTKFDHAAYARLCKYAEQLKPMTYDCPRLQEAVQAVIRLAEAGNQK